MVVKDLISEPALTCRMDETLQDAADRMREAGVGILVVVDDENRTEAVVTDRDICVAAADLRQPLEHIPVHAARSAVALECSPDDSLEDAMTTMQVNGIRRVVVMDPTRRPIGILSIDDLAAESLLELERGDDELSVDPEELVRTLGEIARGVTQGHRPIPPGAEAMPRPIS